jgi:aminoglycoside/choline kinase family phosphotransferase
MTKEKAQYFFEELIGDKVTGFFTLAQSGSARINFVGKHLEHKYIITCNENLLENESFFYFSEVFTQLQLNSPKIYKISENREMYIQEFLGENTLSEIINSEKLSERVKSLVKQSLNQLFELQTKTENKIDYSKTFEYQNYDELPILNDLFYFKNFIVDFLELSYQKASLLLEFKKLVSKIENLTPKGLMIRDFQARNIMVNEKDEVYFIDYQSAMKGPLMYDVISFLFQAKANFSSDFKEEMLDYYFSLWKDEQKITALKNAVKPLQLIRFMQVLGAYGFRGLVQRKSHFISSVHLGIENLYQFSQNWEEMKNYPELGAIIHALKTEAINAKIENILSH